MCIVAVQFAKMGETNLNAFLGAVNAIGPMSQRHAHPTADGMAVVAIDRIGPECRVLVSTPGAERIHAVAVITAQLHDGRCEWRGDGDAIRVGEVLVIGTERYVEAAGPEVQTIFVENPSARRNGVVIHIIIDEANGNTGHGVAAAETAGTAVAAEDRGRCAVIGVRRVTAQHQCRAGAEMSVVGVIQIQFQRAEAEGLVG